jgi:hypothetical protein
MTRLLNNLIPALNFILENQYWTRLWIVQEIFLAKEIKIHVALYSFDGRLLERLQTEFGPKNGYDTTDWTNWNETMHARREMKSKRLDLHEALYRWSDQECQDPHDQVYGLLGLVHKPKIKVDLTKSICEFFEEIMDLDGTKILARRYAYAEDFTARLMRSLDLNDVDNMIRIRTNFLKA